VACLWRSASFVLLALFLGVALLAGFPEEIVLASGVALAALSLITARSNVKPRYALRPIDQTGRAIIAAGLVAVMAIHASGVVWAFRHFT
jgi:apolipoprotein N-acyltransferase